MKSTLKKKDTVQSWPTNWHQEENSFTGDDLIDAYLKGKQAGRSEMIHILSKQFETNLSIATTVSEKLFSGSKKEKNTTERSSFKGRWYYQLFSFICS